MNRKIIETEYLGNNYEHGEIEVTQKYLGEWSVEGNFDLTIYSEEYEKFCEEINKVIQKFAL